MNPPGPEGSNGNGKGGYPAGIYLFMEFYAMSFLATARKYRPQSFEEIVGQEHVIQALHNAITADRVGHAYLFSGTRGVGKTTVARILAKALNCENGPTVKPCQTCDSCKEITAGNAIDVKEIDGASNRGIESIRSLRETITYPPARDRFKIYIIDEVHMLTQEAFNALLKTLEEPPPYVKFIFATTEPQKLPDTILSRVQRFDFTRLPIGQIVDQLQKVTKDQAIDASDDALRLVALQAEGSMRDAESMMDQVVSFAGTSFTEEQVGTVLRVADRSYYINMFDALLNENAATAMQVLNKAIGHGISPRSFVKGFANFLAQALTLILLPDDPVSGVVFSDVQKRNILATSNNKTAQILLLLDIFVEAADRAVASSYPNLVVLAAVARASLLGSLADIDTIINKLKGMDSRPAAVIPAAPKPARPETSRPEPVQKAKAKQEKEKNRLKLQQHEVVSHIVTTMDAQVVKVEPKGE